MIWALFNIPCGPDPEPLKDQTLKELISEMKEAGI
jgi:hypothetical protein